MSLVSQSTMDEFADLVNQHYEIFSKTLIVHKEPIKTITNINSNPLVGYGEESNTVNYSYTPVSGIFSARIRYDNPLLQHSEQTIKEVNLRIPKGGAVIKVKQNCRDYILNGKTERITTEVKDFNIVSDMGFHDYLGARFYLFTLENTT